MKKYLIVILSLLLPLVWVWAAGEDASKVVSSEQQESEWQPVYGEKGDLLNPQPSVMPLGARHISQRQGEPTINTVTAIVLFEDFESPTDWDGSNPPTGWAVLDSGYVNYEWDNNDWHKYYYSSWSDTVARVYYSPIEDQDEWLITPPADFTGATACSLTFYAYFNWFSSADTFFIVGSSDGVNFTDSIDTWVSDQGSTTKSSSFFAYDITAYADEEDGYQVAFRYVGNNGLYAYVDDATLIKDATQQVYTDFNGWGPYGDNPPTGWTILDVHGPYADPWDNDDWHQYSLSSWGNFARVSYSSSELQNEWLISPSMDFSAGYDQILLDFKQYYHDDTPDTDTGWVLGTTDNWATTQTIAMYTSDQGSSSSSPDYPTYDISSWANNQSDVRLAFKYVADNDWYWYLDSVQVEAITLVTDDVLTEAINSPNIGITGYNHEISVQVYNNGTNTVTFDDSTKIELLNKSILFFENFSNPQGWTGASPPVNTAGTWAIIDSGSTPGTWDNNDWHGYYYSSWSDTVARVYYSPVEDQNEWLITPSLDLSSAPNAHLTFKQYYDDWSSDNTDTAWVLGTSDNWSTTQTIAMYAGADQGSSSNPDYPTYDISSWAAGQSNVKIAFKYVANDDFLWYVDDVEVYTALTPTADYISGETVSSLTSLESREIVYTSTWNDPDPGDYTLTTWTNLSGDLDASNDTMSANLKVYEHFETGGPDAGNYTWDTDKDGGTGDPYSWIDITGTGTPVTWDGGSSDDQYTYGIPMGFSFTFYDVAYDRIYLSKNGYASFDSITSTSSSNYTIPSTSGQENILALLWDDLSDESGGTAYYYSNNVDTFIVTYENWDFDTDLDQRIDMQFILTAGDRGIKYQYQEVGPVIYTSHTIGIENADGDVGLQFIYNGAPLGNIPMGGLAITFGYNPPSIDAALSTIDEPIDNAIVYNGSTVTPTVTVLNNSDIAHTIDVTYIINNGVSDVYNQTETTASIPGGGGSLQYAFTTTWNADPDGEYDVTAYVTLTGDGNPANDTVTSSFEVGTHYSGGGPDDFGYLWIDNISVSDEDPPVFDWVELSTGLGTLIDPWPNGTSGDSYYSDLINMGLSSGFEFYGTTYDSVMVNINGWLSFSAQTSTYHYPDTIPDDGDPNNILALLWSDLHLRDGSVYYYTDVGNNRFIVQYKDVEFYSPSGSTINAEVIINGDGTIIMQYLSFGPGMNTDITVGIENSDGTIGLGYLESSGSSNPGTPIGNLPTDTLAIKWYVSLYAHDVKVDQFNAPGPSGSVNDPIDPEVLFVNNGTSDETNIPVYLYIDPGAYADTQTIAVLDSGTSYAQTFSQFTPTSSGIYTMTAVSELAGDEDPLTDTLVMHYSVFDTLIDFEAGNGGLAGTGDWEWGEPTNPEGPAGAYSGSKLWATNLAGDYTETFSTLTFGLAVGTTNPGLGIASWYDTELKFDGGNFAVSTDGGATWEVISPDIGYVDTCYTPPIEGDSIFTSHDQGFWETPTFDLSAYSGQNVLARFAFIADGSAFYPGWHIDDLGLVDCDISFPEIDVTPTVVDGQANPSEADTVEVTVSNTGTGTLIFDVSAAQDMIPAGIDGVNLPRTTVSRTPLGYRPIEMKQADPGSDLFYKEELYDPKAEHVLEPYYPPVIDGAGGPDAFGYEWIDSDEPGGPTVTFKDISGTGTQVVWVNTSTDDHYSASIPIGFTFDFYGVPYTSVYVSENGVISFDSLTSGYFINSSIPSSSDPNNIISPWWDDLAQASGSVLYYFDSSDSTFTVSYNGVENFFYGGNLNFQMVLHTGGDIEFNYGTMNPGSDDLESSTIGIENAAGDDGLEIVYNASYMHDNLSILIQQPIRWLSTSILSGSIDPGSPAVPFDVIMDASLLGEGTYTGNVTISSNDPDESEITIPVTFIVGGGGGGDCEYVTGDVNGSDSYNGLDITYGVNYFKGGSTPLCPLGSCPISPCDAFYYCGDVNGSCSYNGLDITYGVSYFKGGPGPIPCDQCPPAGSEPASIGNELKPDIRPAVESTLKSKSESKKGNSLDK